jgi:hypothetical protein
MIATVLARLCSCGSCYLAREMILSKDLIFALTASGTAAFLHSNFIIYNNALPSVAIHPRVAIHPLFRSLLDWNMLTIRSKIPILPHINIAPLAKIVIRYSTLYSSSPEVTHVPTGTSTNSSKLPYQAYHSDLQALHIRLS